MGGSKERGDFGKLEVPGPVCDLALLGHGDAQEDFAFAILARAGFEESGQWRARTGDPRAASARPTWAALVILRIGPVGRPVASSNAGAATATALDDRE